MDAKARWRWLLEVAGRTADPNRGARHGQKTLEPSGLFPDTADECRFDG